MTKGRHPVLAIVFGGMIGALMRAGLVEALPHPAGAWPWATFSANLAGAFLLGVVVTRHEHYDAHPRWRPFLGTGLAGALTTFSTLQVEVLDFLDDGHVGLAASYALSSVALGLAAVTLATWAVHRTHAAGAA